MFDVSQIPLFRLADRRFAWLDQRQQILARNIANADTPGWRARDMKPFTAQAVAPGFALTRTNPLHLAAAGGAADTATGEVVRGEQAPDGNGIALDKELMKVAQTDTAHELTTELTRKYLSLFRTAIGR